ncbi:MAG TPA: CHAT domain-containing protein [Thermoanaerobaculia bacterium]
MNDFAVAHFEYARRDVKSLIISLDAAEKAWELHPTPSIAWTRAVGLSALAAEETAENAWNEFLALDQASDWAKEAIRRRAQLRLRRARMVSSEPRPTIGPLDEGFSLIERYDELVAEYLRNSQFDRAAAILTYRAEALDQMRAADEALSDLVKARKLVSSRTLVGRRVVGALALAARRRGYGYAARALAPGGMPLPPGPRAVYASVRPTSDPDELDLSIEFIGASGFSQHDDAAFEILIEAQQHLYRRQAAIHIANGSPAAALWMSDRARIAPIRITGRCGNSDHGRSVTSRARQLARCVPDGVTIIHQDLDDDALNTWIVRDGLISFHAMPVAALRLRAEIETLAKDLRSAQHLYDVLLRPIEHKIAGNDLLVYSPSPNLRAVPVTALHDGTAFLVQRRRIMTTASVSSFELPRMLSSTESAFVLLPTHASGVGDLPGARREVRAVGDIYGARATVLTDAAATPEAFLERAARYDILHLSSHGYASDLPYQNAIEFGARRIRAYDVNRLRLRRAPIVVLAACHTASDSGGPLNMSLASAFLRAGASSVIGSLWKVEDADTADLSVAFHRELARGATPHDALRTVQLQFIRDGKPMSTWAAFQAYS